jgi:hypothetical protein
MTEPTGSIGMKALFIVPVVLAGCAFLGCRQKPGEPGPPETPAPVHSASPETNPTPPPPAMPAESPSSSPPAAVAEATPDRPQFSSQSANEFVNSYDAFVADFKIAYEAMKNRDMTKYETVISRAQELEIKVSKIETELPPDEQKKFVDYLNRRANELAAIANAK